MVKHELVIQNLPAWASRFSNSQESSSPSRPFKPAYSNDEPFLPYAGNGLRDLEEMYGDSDAPAQSAPQPAAQQTQEELDDIFFSNLRNSPPPIFKGTSSDGSLEAL